jgi:hypothetical protein
MKLKNILLTVSLSLNFGLIGLGAYDGLRDRPQDPREAAQETYLREKSISLAQEFALSQGQRSSLHLIMGQLLSHPEAMSMDLLTKINSKEIRDEFNTNGK